MAISPSTILVVLTALEDGVIDVVCGAVTIREGTVRLGSLMRVRSGDIFNNDATANDTTGRSQSITLGLKDISQLPRNRDNNASSLLILADVDILWYGTVLDDALPKSDRISIIEKRPSSKYYVSN